MFDNVISEETRANISIASTLEILKPFYLAGGTGCALYIGHRLSYDMDFFSAEKFDGWVISRTLSNAGDFVIDYSDKDTLIGKFNNTRISFMYYKYPLVKGIVRFLNINIASIEDIGCMKIEAIAARGKKRDFVDLYAILKKINLDLAEFFQFYKEKYSGEKYNEAHILKSLYYFDDAENDPGPNLLFDVKWEHVKKFFREQKAILDYAVLHGIKFR